MTKKSDCKTAAREAAERCKVTLSIVAERLEANISAAYAEQEKAVEELLEALDNL